MQTLTQEALVAAQGADVLDASDRKIGQVEDVYYDDDTGQPEWIGIGVGIFGLKRRVVPVAGATMTGDGSVRVPFDKDLVKSSPDVDGEEIEPGRERELYEYYGVAPGGVSDLQGGGIAEVRLRRVILVDADDPRRR